MCGIVGAISRTAVTTILVDGLKKLEYRGYDSAGLAIINSEKEIERVRVVGKVKELENALAQYSLQGNLGIAHTRWATHGVPTEKNAHPFISRDDFALVHNGIIENHALLRAQLIKDGYEFNSDTDTEVIVHLLHQHFQQTKNLLAAIRSVVGELKGAYALGVIARAEPNAIFAVRKGSPLVIGVGEDANYLASDPLAMIALTQEFIYLEDNDIAEIAVDGFNIFNLAGQLVDRQAHSLTINQENVSRGKFRHFMKKEIMEQPQAIKDCLEHRLHEATFADAALLQKVENVHLVACGTSYHAALVARYWIESLAQIPCTVEVASEFRYRQIAQPKNALFVTLSQSGETADTLAALRLAKSMQYLSTLVICNVPGSTMTREAELHFLTRAGVEIGVASTKAFVTQLTALLLLALQLRHAKRNADDKLAAEIISALEQLPAKIATVLEQDENIIKWASAFTDKSHALFIGRNALYPIALEGALKMKEISYIHAEGYPAGELKHGPLALVDTNMPVICTAPDDDAIDKCLSNLQEVRTRGGELFILTDQPALFEQGAFLGANVITCPVIHPILTPILYTVPLQLLAYHVAVLKGTDVDQPRNLAKSVTVE